MTCAPVVVLVILGLCALVVVAAAHRRGLIVRDLARCPSCGSLDECKCR